MNCPNCGSDQTRRLQVIYEQGTSDSIGGAVLFGDNMGYAVTESTSQTILAQKSAPPSKKMVLIWAILTILCFLVALGGGYWAGLIGAVFLFLCFQNMRYNREKWSQLFDKWLKGWYCFKCGKAFLQK